MASIRDLDAGTYEWTRAQARRGRSELVAGGQVVATLTWDRAWNSKARAEVDGHTWSFRRRGLIRKTITVETDESASAPTVSSAGWRRAFRIEASSGSVYRFVQERWTGSRWAFVPEGTDDRFIRSPRGGLFWAHYETEISPAAVGHDDLPFLACLGAWLHSLLDGDVRVASVVGTSV